MRSFPFGAMSVSNQKTPCDAPSASARQRLLPPSAPQPHSTLFDTPTPHTINTSRNEIPQPSQHRRAEEAAVLPYRVPMRLKGQVAVVTGIGAGIGEAIALRFAEEGARLVLADINQVNGERTLTKVRESGTEAVLVVADIAKDEDARRIAETAIGRFGQIDILVNNAADFTQMGIESASLEDWYRVYGVNVFGTALVSKYVVPYMKERRKGSIVNVGSMSGIIAQKDFATYSSSKGAIQTLTRCMALDYAPFNIRVNTVCPGCILTSASYREIERLGLTFEQWRDQVAPGHMLNRLGEPREAANAALFLASDDASFITAAHLMVDGGYIAH